MISNSLRCILNTFAVPNNSLNFGFTSLNEIRQTDGKNDGTAGNRVDSASIVSKS